MPKVSVIIPVYNVEKYLRKCLDSVVDQTLSDIEIICVDDCSTDNSLEILKEYAAKDNRFVILKQKENQGQGVARNKGLDLVTGEYVYFIDSDDWIELDTIEILLNKMLNNKVDCVVHRVINIVDDENCKDIAKACQDWLDDKNRLEGIYDVPININKNIASIPCNKLYKMSIINKYHCRFPEGLIEEDEAFIWFYMIHCKKYYFLDKSLYSYLRRKNSTMGMRNRSLKIIDILKIQKIIFETVAKYKNINEYKIELTNNYINQVSDLWRRMPKKYREEALKLIMEYRNTNDDERIKKLYYRKKYEMFFEILEKIFSVKNKYKHKVITLLGIKFKFKSKKLIKKLNLHENSFMEDIFSVKNLDGRKTVTILGIKLKFRIGITPLKRLSIAENHKCLVIAPHPDDESIGLGGLLLTHPRNFDAVVLSDGRYGGVLEDGRLASKNPEKMVQLRWNELKNAMKFIGIKNFQNLMIEDKSVSKHLNKLKEINLKQYDYIFVPNSNENHVDHRNILKKVKQLLRFETHTKILSYEVWTPLVNPNLSFNINHVVEKKKELLKLYESQVRSLDYVNISLSLNCYRGTRHVKGYAECFKEEKTFIQKILRK